MREQEEISLGGKKKNLTGWKEFNVDFVAVCFISYLNLNVNKLDIGIFFFSERKKRGLREMRGKKGRNASAFNVCTQKYVYVMILSNKEGNIDRFIEQNYIGSLCWLWLMLLKALEKRITKVFMMMLWKKIKEYYSTPTQEKTTLL